MSVMALQLMPIDIKLLTMTKAFLKVKSFQSICLEVVLVLNSNPHLLGNSLEKVLMTTQQQELQTFMSHLRKKLIWVDVLHLTLTQNTKEVHLRVSLLL